MTKITFEDLPSTNTPLNASNLNTMQDNIEDAIPTIDSAVSTSSTNAVENQAITNYVEQYVDSNIKEYYTIGQEVRLNKIYKNGAIEKPVYRRIWSGTINDTQITLDEITNKQTTVAVGGTFTSAGGYTNSIPFHSGDAAYCRLVVNESNSRPIITTPSAMNGSTYVIYVEYTKTTD